jgi:hypothetical protein
MEHRDLGAPDIRIHYVRVTNHLDVPFTDRWDGIPVTLEPGKGDNLQLDMAAHFFGYHFEVPRDVMFRHVCKRQGWNTPAYLVIQPSGKSLAQEMFDKLEIKPVVMKMVEVAPDLDAPIPADPDMPAFTERDSLEPPPRKGKG